MVSLIPSELRPVQASTVKHHESYCIVPLASFGFYVVRASNGLWHRWTLPRRWIRARPTDAGGASTTPDAAACLRRRCDNYFWGTRGHAVQQYGRRLYTTLTWWFGVPLLMSCGSAAVANRRGLGVVVCLASGAERAVAFCRSVLEPLVVGARRWHCFPTCDIFPRCGIQPGLTFSWRNNSGGLGMSMPKIMSIW